MVCACAGGSLVVVGHLCLAGFSVGQPMLCRTRAAAGYLQRLTWGEGFRAELSEQTAFTWCSWQVRGCSWLWLMAQPLLLLLLPCWHHAPVRLVCR